MYKVRVKRGAGPAVPERAGAQPSHCTSTPQFGCGSTAFSERGAARFNEGQDNESESTAKELAAKAKPAADWPAECATAVWTLPRAGPRGPSGGRRGRDGELLPARRALLACYERYR